VSSIIDELKRKRDDLLVSLDDTANRIAALPPDAPEEERGILDEIFQRDNDSVKRLTADIKRREEIMRQRSELAAQDEEERDTSGSSDRRIRVREPLVYERNNGASFYRDVWLASSKDHADADARERLERHVTQMRVEKRDISTTAGGGGEFVPPAYLQDQWITLARAGRADGEHHPVAAADPGEDDLPLPEVERWRRNGDPDR
jgi:hypothetical protein